ncbi:MAG: hypothetical protein VZR54_05495 [Ruminococcus sp.]|nr:hypothetical protein [Ruminococcus sp.]
MKKTICVLLAVITLMTTGIQAFAVKKQFTGKVKSGSHTYYYINGKKLKNGVYTYKGNCYKFSKNGDKLKGWYKIGKGYCLFDRKTGRRVSGKKVDGIRIKRNGFAKYSKLNYKKIRTMIKARKILNSITKPTDTKSRKRLKCFKWVQSFPYKRFRRLRQIYKKKGWECDFANDEFYRHAGCCVSNASSVAFLFREIGYSKVYVCHDTSHAWASMGGRIYDPLFAESKSFKKNYNAIPTDYRKNPSYKRLIG